MRYVFVCPDVNFLMLQYRDFEKIKNGSLVRVGRFVGRLSKALNILGIARYKIIDKFFYKIFEKIFFDIKNDNEYCFILYSRVFENFQGAVCRFLKEKYHGCKIVVYYGDLVSMHKVSINDAKFYTDEVFSFDRDDARKYDIQWLLEPLSASINDMKELAIEECQQRWDVTFVGRAKNRYDKIISIYERLNKAGLRCDFHITGVSKRKRKYEGSISYDALSFMDLLKHVSSSKCILEIMQDNAFSPTTRYTEAMLFGKNLLTDCIAFKNERPENVIYFSNLNDIDEAMINKLIQKSCIDRTKYIEEFSIETMIKNIDLKLKCKVE